MSITNKILSYFSEMNDPQVERTKRHHIDDIVFIAIASVLSGIVSWNEMEQYGLYEKECLKWFFNLPNGIRSLAPY